MTAMTSPFVKGATTMRLRVPLLAAAVVAAVALIAVGCGGGGEKEGAVGGGKKVASQVLKMAWGAEPPSLDPGLATDTTSSNVLLNIMDPLVRLGDDLQPVPALAESWDVDGKVVTFHLRDDGRWTNVTGRDGHSRRAKSARGPMATGVTFEQG
jgi:ABC-type oligopeptide transport system substrate-binding subunit